MERLLEPMRDINKEAVEFMRSIRKVLSGYLNCDLGNLYFNDVKLDQQTEMARLDDTITLSEDCFWRCWLCVKLFKND